MYAESVDFVLVAKVVGCSCPYVGAKPTPPLKFKGQLKKMLPITASIVL